MYPGSSEIFRQILAHFLERIAEYRELSPGFLSRLDIAELAKAVVMMPDEMIEDSDIADLCSKAGLTPNVLAAARHTLEMVRKANAVASLEEVSVAAYYKSRTPQEKKLNEYWEQSRLEVLAELPLQMHKAATEEVKARARKGAAARHAGDHEKRDQMQRMWAEGNHMTRESCAAEAAKRGFGKFQTLRNQLKGTPSPDPWPARKCANKARTKRTSKGQP